MLAVLVAGCGSHVHSAAISPGVAARALRGSPPPLTSLHAQANRLLPGGTGAFHRRLSALRGYPVVVNKWASWCGPCQSEFPIFQRVAVSYGRRVAFLGVDGKDTTAAARSFLHGLPLSYPSYSDPQQSISNSIEAASYFPQTVFFDRRGQIVFDHAGSYADAGTLERDIRRYALGSS